MPDIAALAVLATAFAIGEFVAYKTKANFSTVLVTAFVLLIGFWTVVPKTLFADARIVPIGRVLIGILIVGMGTTLDFPELKRQWKTVIVATLSVLLACGLIYIIGPAIIGRDLAFAGVPIFAGAGSASMVMTMALNAQERYQLALFVVLILTCQTFVGIPIASQLLKISARKFKKDTALYNIYLDPVEEDSSKKKRRLLQLPEELTKPSAIFAKMAIVATIGFYIFRLSGGRLNYIVVALILGTVFTELGFLEPNSLVKSQASTFVLLACVLILFESLTEATPAGLLSLMGPLVVVLGIGVAGSFGGGLLFGKIFRVEPFLAICMCLTCTFGFPTTMFMSNEVAAALGEDEKDRDAISRYLLPKMITAGFITGIVSIFLASWMAGII